MCVLFLIVVYSIYIQYKLQYAIYNIHTVHNTSLLREYSIFSDNIRAFNSNLLAIGRYTHMYSIR